MVRRPGIEPGPPAWKAGILTTELTTLLHVDLIKIVTGVGFEPTPPKRLVPKTSALDHSATQPQHWGKVHASAWDRTRDLSVNSRALYQLSHGGNFTCEVTPWRNGSALDSKSKGWGFESLWGHLLHREKWCTGQDSNLRPHSRLRPERSALDRSATSA